MADHADALIAAVREAATRGQAPPAAIRNALVALDDPAAARKIGRLLDRPGIAAGDLRPTRVMLAATATVGSFEPLLRTALVGAGLWPELSAAEYGTFEMTLATGDLASIDPDLLVCVLDEGFFLPREWDPTALDDLEAHLVGRAGDLATAIGRVIARSRAAVVLHTVPVPAEARDAVISLAGRARLARVWNRLNDALLELADTDPRITVVDLVGALADAPVAARDDRLHRYADMPYTDGALLVLAREVRRAAQARAGLSRKVLALDLDNTLWGGVLGEVGAAGVSLGGLYPGNCYTALQRAATRLRAQGVVLVLASKNDAEAVDEALTRHPEMLLRPEAFAARVVNWSAKGANLRQAADALALSPGSFVFMDDSAYERGQVAAELPDVALVAADGDPAHLVRSLLRDGWFDVPRLTETDLARPELYRTRALRETFSETFATPTEYLAALDLEVVVERADEFSAARVAQLAARTNQYNLTGVRPDEVAVAAMVADPDGWLVMSFAVNDRFGSEGIIGAAWVRRGPVWQVDNLVMSCRVLGRGVELAVVGWIAAQARAAGAARLEGRFVPSAKNHVAAGIWETAGFTPSGDPETFHRDLGDPAAPDDLVPAWVRLTEGSSVANARRGR